MNILVTNDDGILAPGLALLADVCREVANVTVVAPDREQSGTSHSLTLHRPLRPARRPDGAWQIDGTPTDCAMLAIQALMPERPDFAFLGREPRPQHGRGRAVLGHRRGGDGGGDARRAGHRHLVLREPARDDGDVPGRCCCSWCAGSSSVPNFPEQTLLNINLPRIPASEVRGIQVTKLGSRYFSESLTRMKDPWGREIFWIGGGTITWTGGENSDHLAVAEGYISVTPLHMDLTNYSLLETVRGWSLEG